MEAKADLLTTGVAVDDYAKVMVEHEASFKNVGSGQTSGRDRPTASCAVG